LLFSGGFCFAYNADLFYRDIFPGYDLGWSLFVVTFLVGSVGVVIGGVTSDSIVKKYGIRSRVAVLAISQVCEHRNTRNLIITDTLPPILLLCHNFNLVQLVNYIATIIKLVICIYHKNIAFAKSSSLTGIEYDML